MLIDDNSRKLAFGLVCFAAMAASVMAADAPFTYTGNFSVADHPSLDNTVVATFTSSGTLTMTNRAKIVRLLVVGGGGGGGGLGGGGGGGVSDTTPASIVASGDTIAVTVGAGGSKAVKGSYASVPFAPGSTGGSSSFGTLASALGGSGGGGWEAVPLSDGANGGGGAPAGNAANAATIQAGASGGTGGHAGGNATNSGSSGNGCGGGGGGGGAGGNGGNSAVTHISSHNDTTLESAGAGGVGLASDITGSAVYYGGGGGGGVRRSNYKYGGQGGSGGGGRGFGATPGSEGPSTASSAMTSPLAATDGTDGLGGGGGGGGWDASGGDGYAPGDGGDGVVIALIEPLGDYYVGVEYIECDGNQYIDTLWTNGSDHVVTLDIQPTELPTSNNTSGSGGVRTWYGCRSAYNVKNISFFMDYQNNAPAITVDFNSSSHTPYRLSAGSLSADRRYVVVDSAATRSVTGYDSSSNVVTTASDTDNCSDTFTCDGSAYLFAINDMSGGSPAFLWGNKAKVKFYGGTVETVGGTVCCNLVPCLKNGAEPGVYDTVRNIFLPNSGSGTFTYGAKTEVISGEAPEDEGDDPVAREGLIPDGYTEIEYIQGDGSSARILTDYTPNHLTDKIEAVVSWTAVDKTATIWCTRGATSSTDSWTVFMVNDSGYKFRLDYGTSKNGYASPLTVAANTIYTVTVEDKRIDVVGGAQPANYEYPQSLSFADAGPISLFASYYDGTGNHVDNYGKHKLYSFKVWRSGELIHYFVPCKDSGGAATLVDICDNPATLTKTGTFTAGQEGHFYDDTLFTIPDDTLAIAGSPGNYGSPSPAYGKETGLEGVTHSPLPAA